MPRLSSCLAAPLCLLSLFQTAGCYTYQTRPLFLSFSELAALEGNSGAARRTDRPLAEEAWSLVVRCLEDGIEVVLRGGRSEEPRLRLGPGDAWQHPCTASPSGNGDYSIRASLTDCGSHVVFTHSSVLYNNNVLLLLGDPIQEGATLPVQCEYRRRYTVSSGALKPTWSPLTSIQSTHLTLNFRLTLMTDDWSSRRTSPVYTLGETVNIEASADDDHPLPLRLYADSCVATLTPDVNSYPRYPFIDHQGCFTDSQLRGSRSRFLPRVRDRRLRIRLQPFLFHQDRRNTIFITCHLEAEPVSNNEPVKRACSFIRGSWRSVDGEDHVCESCSGTANSVHKRAVKSGAKHKQAELKSLGPILFLNTAQKHQISVWK